MWPLLDYLVVFPGILLSCMLRSPETLWDVLLGRLPWLLVAFWGLQLSLSEASPWTLRTFEVVHLGDVELETAWVPMVWSSIWRHVAPAD